MLEAVLLLTGYVVPLVGQHNVTSDDVFHQLPGYAGERLGDR